VRFVDALNAAHQYADLFIEVGPGRLLSKLVSESSDRPVIALDVGGDSIEGLLMALGAAYVAGAAVEPAGLFGDRFTRPFDIDWRPRFFTNPCELVPTTAQSKGQREAPTRGLPGIDDEAAASANGIERHKGSKSQRRNILDLLRHLVAGRTELPPTAIRDEDRLLGDLHLNSITVSQLVIEAANH